ncbi:MAG: phosphatidylglycerophosphatase A [Bacteriovoracaceae bacterium]|nr:phosphatidylglycerophosphatase A [Bacteriovoracaceae bacterium]
MTESKKPSLKDPEIIFLSFFGVGFVPKAPGTFGTLATLPFLYALGLVKPPIILFIPLLIIATIVSCFIANVVQEKLSLHDPQWIVMDEVLGMSTAWIFIQKFDLLHLFILFVLFRFFDIIKFWPASYFDKEMKHGAGTILDDIVSGVFAGCSYLAINYFL